jgi:hypothetical protein
MIDHGPYTWSIQQTEDLLHASATGLSSEEVRKRRHIFGKNVF